MGRLMQFPLPTSFLPASGAGTQPGPEGYTGIGSLCQSRIGPSVHLCHRGHLMRVSKLLLLPLAIAVFASGCDLPRAWGDVNALVVAADDDFWAASGQGFVDAIEPTIQAVRNERPYRIQQMDPSQPEWGNLQRFRQVIAIGTASDPWIAEALAKVPDADLEGAPKILQAQDVWARGQLVSILLLAEGGDPAEGLAEVSVELRTLLDRQFREYALSRMFVSGAHETLGDSLAANVGFTLYLPSVYRYTVQDSVFLFRNDNPSPAELIREVVVSWQSPIPEVLPTRSDLETWRTGMAAAHYNYPQIIDTTVVSFGEVEANGTRGLEYQAAWTNPPGTWPAGGPFITRVLPCPSQDRLYFVDAWLYAPDRDKYEYMIQLQTILDSFACRDA